MPAKKPSIPPRFMREADEKYGTGSSAYKSLWALRQAKKRDSNFRKRYEAYQKSLKGAPTGLDRWLQEKWIQVGPYLKDGTIKVCGSKNETRGKACRPLKRITADTPVTIKELKKVVPKKKLSDMVKEKQKQPQKRMQWKKVYDQYSKKRSMKRED